MSTPISPPATYPDALTSDPAAMRWMVGSPPPPDKLIRFADGKMRELTEYFDTELVTEALSA